MTDRLPTGLSVFDRRIGGGLLTEQVYALVTPADSQSELVFGLLTAAASAHVVSTVRPAEEIRRDFERMGLPESLVTVASCTASELTDDPERWLTPPEGGYLIVDPFDPVERVADDAFLDVLTAMKRAVTEANAVGVVHCLEESAESYSRRLALKRVDGVARLEMERGTQAIETRLLVTKYRNGEAVVEPVKLRLTDHVTLDTSRDIA